MCPLCTHIGIHDAHRRGVRNAYIRVSIVVFSDVGDNNVFAQLMRDE